MVKKGGKAAGRGAKKLCRLFGDELTEDGQTVKDFCEEQKNELKDTITAVCEAGDFGDDTRQGKICAKLIAEDTDTTERRYL